MELEYPSQPEDRGWARLRLIQLDSELEGKGVVGTPKYSDLQGYRYYYPLAPSPGYPVITPSTRSDNRGDSMVLPCATDTLTVTPQVGCGKATPRS